MILYGLSLNSNRTAISGIEEENPTKKQCYAIDDKQVVKRPRNELLAKQELCFKHLTGLPDDVVSIRSR